MPDLSIRATGPEIMDDLAVAGPDLQQALRELDAINYLLGGNYVTLNGLSRLIGGTTTKPLRIADVGCGSGDMLRRMRAFLQTRKTQADLTGFDANANVIDFAKSHTPASCRISYEVLDIFSPGFATQEFDIITGTLFFHHFTSERLARFFAQLKEQARVGIVINDLHRHWFAYHAIKCLTGIASRSAMVRNDAPLSVMRGFRRHELMEILQKAGIRDFTIKWCWAFRWQVVVKNGTFFVNR